MPLEGQWERQTTPLPLNTPKARRILAIAALIAVLGVGALVWATSGSKTALGPGCISLTLASTTGGAQYHACGDGARAWCRQDGPKTTADAAKLRAACRREGYPIS
jgi:hypothetical protein